MDRPMDVLRDYPVRKSKLQKQAFREAVLAYSGALGFEARVEKGSFGVRNVVIGNSEQAKYNVLYLAKIHTAKDRVLDEGNVRLIRDTLLAVVSEQEEAACK